MKLAAGTALRVDLAFDSTKPPLAAARLAMDAGLAQLEWTQDIIASRLHLSPIYYPPERGLAAARSRSFEGLHGFLADSLPDGWGHLVMRKRLAKLGVNIETLTPLERLALVGSHGRGALRFEPATTPPDEIETLDLDRLAEDSAALLIGEEAGLADTLARLAGGSGGARPKVHVGFDGGGQISIGDGETPPGFEAWIVKFRAPNDPKDIGPIEAAYAAMASAAGLLVSPYRLIPARRGPGYFATRRFDRQVDGRRLHMVSLSGAIEAPAHVPSSYELLLRATRAITRRSDDVEAAFRRMVFNVRAHNRDDHTRQHAYLMDHSGDWRLSPAFDLTFSQGPGGEHYLDVEGEGRRPTHAHVVALGKKHGIDAKRIAIIIDQTAAAVADWPKHANTSGVTKASMSLISEAHDRVRSEFEAP